MQCFKIITRPYFGGLKQFVELTLNKLRTYAKKGNIFAGLYGFSIFFCNFAAK